MLWWFSLFNGDPVAAAEYATITDITNTNFKIYMYANNAGTGYANAKHFLFVLGLSHSGDIIHANGAIYTDVTTPVSFSRCFWCVNRHTTSRIYYLAGNYSDCLEH